MSAKEIDINKLHLQPKPVQIALALAAAIVLVVIGYFALFQSQWEEYQSQVAKETELREEYEKKAVQAASLDNLKEELVLIEKSIDILLKQLPTQAEIPPLIQELNQAAARNGLTMGVVEPKNVVVEKPIERIPFAISVSGNYDQIAQFMRDIGKMSRIVTLSNISLTGSDGSKKGSAGKKLTLTALANTYKALEVVETASAVSAPAAAETTE